jgi:hypothetical protein
MRIPCRNVQSRDNLAGGKRYAPCQPHARTERKPETLTSVKTTTKPALINIAAVESRSRIDMVRRRSTVRFRNGAPVMSYFRTIRTSGVERVQETLFGFDSSESSHGIVRARPAAWEPRNCRQVGDARRGCSQDPPDRSCPDAVPQAGEFTLDAPVSPPRVLPGQLLDQLTDLLRDRRASGW